jgi:phosphate acetyltransferase
MASRTLSEALMAVLIERARQRRPKIVFPEGTDERVVRGALQAAWQGSCHPILLGPREEIVAAAERQWLAFPPEMETLNPPTDSHLADYSAIYAALRETDDGKKISPGAAKRLMEKPLYFASMMVRHRLVDGMVAGATETTARVVTAASAIIRSAPHVGRPASAFLMMSQDQRFGDHGAMLFADAALIPDPTAQELVWIAWAAARMWRNLLGGDVPPRVALLSFSTAGSANHPLVQKVREAGELLAARNPPFAFDAEVQLDAALIPDVAERKLPNSRLGGRANVLVFPDLNSGNICYKLAERLAGRQALGPFILGLNAPVSDLSRGCSADDIAKTAAILAATTVG